MTDLFAASNALKGSITLTADEVDSLRELIAMLATMEERGFDIEKPGCLVVSQQLWRDMVLRPAMGLRRVTTRKLDSPEKTT